MTFYILMDQSAYCVVDSPLQRNPCFITFVIGPNRNHFTTLQWVPWPAYLKWMFTETRHSLIYFFQGGETQSKSATILRSLPQRNYQLILYFYESLTNNIK